MNRIKSIKIKNKKNNKKRIKKTRNKKRINQIKELEKIGIELIRLQAKIIIDRMKEELEKHQKERQKIKQMH